MRTPTALRGRVVGVIAALVLLAFAAPAVADDTLVPMQSLAPALTAQPSSPGNDLVPHWSFAGDPGATFECSLTRGDAVVGDWTACESPATYDLSSQPDGTYTFGVRSIALDGSVSAVASSDYVLDTSVPALPTILTLPGPVASNRAPGWSFAGGEGERFECRLDRGSKTIAGWAECSSPQSFDLADQPDGSYVFSVRGLADNGTRGPVQTDTYLLDTQAPAAPHMTSAPPELGSGRSPAVGFTAEAGAQVQCRAGSGANWIPCESPYSFDLGGQADGDYTLAMRAVDAAGNAGPETTAGYTLDTTAPGAPTVDAPAADAATRLQPSFSFSGADGDTYECRLDGPGGYATGWASCASPAPYDLTGQPDGTYTFAVRATDAAGNTGEAGFANYDLARDPEAVDLQSSPGAIGSDRRPRWSFDASGGETFLCSLGFGGGTVFKPATCGSPRTYNLSGRPDGRYSFTVRGYDHDGVALQPATQEYELDSTAPARPDVDATPVSPARDRSPAWSFSGEDGAALECRVDRGSAGVVDWTPCTHPKDFDLGNGGDGTYQVSVRARDAAGNYSADTTADYQLDSTPPAAPAVTAAPKAQDIDRSPTWKISAESGAVLTCSLTRGSDEVAAKGPCTAAQTYNLSGAQPGVYTFKVQATDAAGNTSRAKVARYVLAAAPALKTTGDGGDGSGTGTGSGDGAGVQPPGTATPGTNGTAPPRAVAGRKSPGATRRAGTGSPGQTAPSATGGQPAGAGARAAGRAAEPVATHGRSQAASHGVPIAGGSFGSGIAGALGGLGKGLIGALRGPVGLTVFPISILILIALFLLVHVRIDRRDPKIALAPIDGDPEMEFPPAPTRR